MRGGAFVDVYQDNLHCTVTDCLASLLQITIRTTRLLLLDAACSRQARRPFPTSFSVLEVPRS